MNANQELQEALYELCQATMKVMRIAYNGTIPAEFVSDTVKTTLQHLVNVTDNVGVANVSTASAPQPSSAQPVSNPQTTVSTNTKQVVDVLYGHNPTNRNGSYMWPRLSSDKDQQRYKITKYADGSAEFELLNLSGDDLNSVWQAKDDSIPSAVVSVSGAPSDCSTLVTTTPGKGIINGRIVVVESPCVAEFKN